ncbi:hypothetical protein [Kitasatospora sp. NPDC088134]|uniref:hypothetical protein n=1 Tax=Kitasatospora sp. NPDC088134 TaxID=3364071 RepID=UPI003809CA6B
MRRRTVLASMAGALLTTAVPTGARAAEGGSERPGRWRSEEFPAGNASVQQVSAVGGGEVWAVGSRRFGQGRGNVTTVPVLFARGVHDRVWRERALPEGLAASTVSSDGAGGVWLTGRSGATGIPAFRHRAGRWQALESPVPEHAVTAGFGGLAAAGGPDDVWAVGAYQPDDLLTFYGLIAHWDGRAWTRVAVPALDTDYWTLSAVVAAGPADVWAAGSIGTPEGWARPLLLRWDGRSWRRFAAPELDSRYGELTRLVAAGPGEVWAAGSQNDASRDQRPLLARFDGRRWTHRDTGIAAGRLEDLVRTPSGLAVVGAAGADGVFRPTGAELTRRGWEPLDLPQGTTAGGRFPTGVVSVAGRLTVVGLDSAGRAPDGEPLPPAPFAVSR